MRLKDSVSHLIKSSTALKLSPFSRPPLTQSRLQYLAAILSILEGKFFVKFNGKRQNLGGLREDLVVQGKIVAKIDDNGGPHK